MKALDLEAPIVQKLVESVYGLPILPKHMRRHIPGNQFKRIKQAIRRLPHLYCHWCDTRLTPEEVTADHLLPVCAGGDTRRRNIVPSCLSCNTIRGLAHVLTHREKLKKHGSELFFPI